MSGNHPRSAAKERAAQQKLRKENADRQEREIRLALSNFRQAISTAWRSPEEIEPTVREFERFLRKKRR